MRDYNWRKEWSDAHSASADETAGTRAPSTGAIAMIPTPDAVRVAFDAGAKWARETARKDWHRETANALEALQSERDELNDRMERWLDHASEACIAARTEEREACAQIAERSGDRGLADHVQLANAIAAPIRARSKGEGS